MVSKRTKMILLLNFRLRIILQDTRVMTGHMLAFDKHMNLVLSDCEEFRRIKPKTSSSGTVAQEREQKRTLGLIILRGETIVSMSVDAPPHPALEGQQARLPQAYTGTAMAVPAGCGLTGPVRGVGGPDPTMMLPHGPAAVAPPLPFGRGMPLGTIPSPGFILPPGVPPAGFRPMGMDLPRPGPPPPSVVPQPGVTPPFSFPPIGQPGLPSLGFRGQPSAPPTGVSAPGAPPAGFRPGIPPFALPQGFRPGPPLAG
ncbi:Sm-like ribonucleo protein [Linnemannia elongata AG-77]|uniref:Sm protein B n=1 Tax=Linnemannia elongata AG-77 TaxID=1314771 RepID=A0A197JPA1_9FUNG|nr:Sm-like ribonucleo protein [Linnemannia elongata AG-77]